MSNLFDGLLFAYFSQRRTFSQHYWCSRITQVIGMPVRCMRLIYEQTPFVLLFGYVARYQLKTYYWREDSRSLALSADFSYISFHEDLIFLKLRSSDDAWQSQTGERFRGGSW